MAGIDSYVKLMLHCNGVDGSTTITDSSSSPHTLTAQGDAQIDTAQKEFGTGSLLVSSTSGYVNSADHDDWQLDGGAGSPFTIDSWIRLTDNSSLAMICSHATDGNNKWTWSYTGSNTLLFDFSSGGGLLLRFSAPFSPSNNTWYHVVLERINSDNAATGWKIFTSGNEQTLTKTNGNWNANIPNFTGNFEIGRDAGDGSGKFDGWIDELRISKGIARWTANFTPPTNEYSSASPMSRMIII